MINSRVGNDRADFEVGWDNEMQSEQTQGPWESAVSIFHKTWGYANWDDAAPTYKDTGYPDYTEEEWDHIQQVDNTTALRKAPGGAHTKTTEIVGNMFSTVALGGQFLFNVGPKFDGSYDPWDASVLKGVGDWNRAHPGILGNSRPTHYPIESWGKTMVDDSHIYLGIEKWPADGTVTLRGAGANDISSVKLDGSDAALTYKVEGNDLVITLPAQPDEILPVVTVTTNGAPTYVPTGLTTIGEQATTIPASSLEKFKAPTPKTGETSFTASITSGDKVASGVTVSFDTEGFTDSYAKYKVTVAGQVKGGLTVADLKAGVGPFTIGPNQTARVTLEYDNPAYVLKGFGKDTTVTSVTVKAETALDPRRHRRAVDRRGWQDRHRDGHGLRSFRVHRDAHAALRARRGRHGHHGRQRRVHRHRDGSGHHRGRGTHARRLHRHSPRRGLGRPDGHRAPRAGPVRRPGRPALRGPLPAPEQGGKGGLARTGSNGLLAGAVRPGRSRRRHRLHSPLAPSQGIAAACAEPPQTGAGRS